MTTTHGMLNPGGGNTRPPFFTFLWRLLKHDATFRGIVEFAAIGAVICFFLIGLQPPASPPAPPPPGTAQPPGTTQPPGKATSPTPLSPPVIPGSKSTSTTTQPPVQPGSGSTSNPPPAQAPTQTAKKSLQFFWPPRAAVPQLSNPILVEVDETSFRTSGTAEQQRLNAALAAYRTSRFPDMLGEVVGANAKDRNVQFMRGLAHFNGAGTEPSTSAEQWLRSAAKAGHRQAAALLGALLITAPRGVVQNVTEGVSLIERAAASGDRQAKRLAGIGYLSNDFRAFNPFKAAPFLREAADAGDPEAMVHYARLAYGGIGGVTLDEKVAEDYLRRAANIGSTLAQGSLGAMHLARFVADETFDPAEGVRWLEHAYEQGHSITAIMALFHFHQRDGKRPPWLNLDRSYSVVRSCSGISHGHCQYNNAWALRYGRGAVPNLPRAYAHFVISRELGRDDASKSIDELDKIMSTQQKAIAADFLKQLRGALKPVPGGVLLQRADVTLPSPWAVFPPADQTTASKGGGSPLPPPIVQPTPGTTPATSQAPATSKAVQPLPAPVVAPPASAIHKVNIPFTYVFGDAYSPLALRVIDIDTGPFQTSSERDRRQLLSALTQYNSGRYAWMRADLAIASTVDPNVLFMRGLADVLLNTDQSRRDGATTLRVAADRNQVQAQILLASMQLEGFGIAKDIETGRRPLEILAKSGNRHALRVLAAAHLNGIFGKPDAITGADMMRRSADAGEPLAMAYFARLSQDGNGTAQSSPLAEVYLRKAADAGLAFAQRTLGIWIIWQYREKVLENPSEGVRLLNNLAFDTQDGKRPGEAPSADALTDLAIFYLDFGREPPWKDHLKSMELLKGCIGSLHGPCQFAYATLRQGGLGGMPRDPVVASAHYEIARLNGGSLKLASERIALLAKTMSADQLAATNELVRKLKASLHPVLLPAFFRKRK